MVLADIQGVLDGKHEDSYQAYVEGGGRYTSFRLIQRLCTSWENALVGAGLRAPSVGAAVPVIISCLRCTHPFLSSDLKHQRLCGHCHER
jgi:hypothetical protein